MNHLLSPTTCLRLFSSAKIFHSRPVTNPVHLITHWRVELFEICSRHFLFTCFPQGLIIFMPLVCPARTSRCFLSIERIVTSGISSSQAGICIPCFFNMLDSTFYFLLPVGDDSNIRCKSTRFPASKVRSRRTSLLRNGQEDTESIRILLRNCSFTRAITRCTKLYVTEHQVHTLSRGHRAHLATHSR